MSKPRRLVTVKQACEYGCMGHTKLYEKIGAGVIHAYKRDGKTLIRSEQNRRHERGAAPATPERPRRELNFKLLGPHADHQI